MAADGEQSQGEVLRADAGRPEAVGTASSQVGSHRVRDYQRAGGRMTLLHRARSILRWILNRRQVEQAIDDELQSFLDMAAADRMREGVSTQQARRHAV